MLKLHIPAKECYDELHEVFINTKEQTLQLEHSLVSISKWEEIWHKPFLGKTPMTIEESLDYIRCMTITQNVDPLVYNAITDFDIERVKEYINDPRTATVVHLRKNGRGSNEILTSELIYYYMIELNIPFECQKWHLNRLITLMNVFSAKNDKGKMSRNDILAQNRARNNARKKAHHTRG